MFDKKKHLRLYVGEIAAVSSRSVVPRLGSVLKSSAPGIFSSIHNSSSICARASSLPLLSSLPIYSIRMVRSDAARSSASDSTSSQAARRPSQREILLLGAHRPFDQGSSPAGEHRSFFNISGDHGVGGAGVRSPFVAPGRWFHMCMVNFCDLFCSKLGFSKVHVSVSSFSYSNLQL